MPATHLTQAQLVRLRDTPPLKPEDISLTDRESVRFTDLLRQRRNSAISRRECSPGEIICHEGENGDALYLIRSGTAAIVKGDLDAPLVLARRGCGEIIGEMALLDEMPRSASVVALEPMELVRLPREDFQCLMEASPAADIDLLRKLSRRLRSTDSVLSDLSTTESQLNGRVTALDAENKQLVELQRLRQQTMDLVIHDLRTPLQGITAATDVLLATLPDRDEARSLKLLTYINAHCTRLQHLVDSLIHISRIESGDVQLVKEVADLAPIVGAAVERARLSFEANAMSWILKLPSSLPPVEVDVRLLDRVVTNLLDNAAKYTPHGSTVTVSAWSGADEITLAVTDTGPGIPPEQREQLFERFARGAPDGNRRGGFGLGLTFCRLAVEAHGGRIWIEDGPGGTGCRFLVALPLKQERPTSAEANPIAEP